jgi:hypothetical protein
VHDTPPPPVFFPHFRVRNSAPSAPSGVTTIENVFGVGCQAIFGIGPPSQNHLNNMKNEVFCIGCCQLIPKIIIGIS